MGRSTPRNPFPRRKPWMPPPATWRFAEAAMI